MSEETDNESRNIGYVKSVEFRGKTIQTRDIDSSTRENFAEEVKSIINEIDGVDSVTIAGWDSTGHKQSCQLEIHLKTSRKRINQASNRDGIKVAGNIRSISQLLSSKLEKPYISTFDVYHSPEPVNASRGIYKEPYYLVDVWFR